MTLRRITADSFRNGGMRGCNAQELRNPPMAAADWDALAELGANHARVWLSLDRDAAA